MRTLISEISSKDGEEVEIKGFAQTIRDQGKIVFILLRDATGLTQIVFTKEYLETMQKAQTVTMESVIAVTGLAKKEAQAPGGFEVLGKELEILSLAHPELPIPILEKGSQEEADQSIRLDWRWLDLRKSRNLLTFQVWTTLEAAFRDYWVKNNYIEIHTPKLIGAPSESGAEVFEVKYFDRVAYLAQSPQFYKQMAMAGGFEKVFEIGPVFRAEPSFTSRHATEFTSYDAEFSYIDSHEDVMAEEEKAIAYALRAVKEKHGEAIEAEFDRVVVVPDVPFPRISMKDAKEILKGLNVPSEKEGDLSPEEERRISEYVKEKEGHEFVFITDYPATVRPFYHMRHEDDEKLTKSFDLLWNGLEITTGAQREHRYDVLVSQAKEKGMNVESIQFYLNFFKYGCPPHGGFGMGPNRMIMKLLNLDNVREAMFLYRGVKRLEP